MRTVRNLLFVICVGLLWTEPTEAFGCSFSLIGGDNWTAPYDPCPANQRFDYEGACSAGTCWDEGWQQAISQCEGLSGGDYVMVEHFCGMWDPEFMSFSCQRLCWWYY